MSVTKDLARRMYLAYIETTGLMSYRGSSVLGLTHLSDLAKMSASELRRCADKLELGFKGPVETSDVRDKLHAAIACPAWDKLPPKVVAAWLAAASVPRVEGAA